MVWLNASHASCVLEHAAAVYGPSAVVPPDDGAADGHTNAVSNRIECNGVCTHGHGHGHCHGHGHV